MDRVENSQWVKCITSQGNVRGVALEATSLITEIVRMHGLTDPSQIQALGEALVGAALTASYCKVGERINVNLRGDGWVKQALVEADAEGRLRGCILANQGVQDAQVAAQALADSDGPEDTNAKGSAAGVASSPQRESSLGDSEETHGQQDTPEIAAQKYARRLAAAEDNTITIELVPMRQGPWGDGTLSILRTKDLTGEQPYIGTVPLVTGHLAKDLTYYFTQSEQVPSAVGISVRVEGDRVISAGGFLVQAMPGANAADIENVARQIDHLGGFVKWVEEHRSPVQILAEIFQDGAFMILENRDLVFQCRCSREKVERALVLVGTEELQDMLTKDKGAEVTCEFCNKKYEFDRGSLTALIDKARAASTGAE